MATPVIRHAEDGDLKALTDIYNHYVLSTPTTFDLEPWSLERRQQWLRGFSPDGRHQLFVAEQEGRVLGYGSSTRFRAKAAYGTTVESSVYLDPSATGRGLGRALYTRLLDSLRGTGVHRVMAGMTLPNEASRRLHEAMGFASCGVMPEVGFKFDRYWDVEWMQRPLRRGSLGGHAGVGRGHRREGRETNLLGIGRRARIGRGGRGGRSGRGGRGLDLGLGRGAGLDLGWRCGAGGDRDDRAGPRQCSNRWGCHGPRGYRRKPLAWGKERAQVHFFDLSAPGTTKMLSQEEPCRTPSPRQCPEFFSSQPSP